MATMIMPTSSIVRIVALVLIAMCRHSITRALPMSTSVAGSEGIRKELELFEDHVDLGDTEYYEPEEYTKYTVCLNCTSSTVRDFAADHCVYPQPHGRNRESHSCVLEASIKIDQAFCCDYEAARAIYCSNDAGGKEDTVMLSCECHFNSSLLEQHSCSLYVTMRE